MKQEVPEPPEEPNPYQPPQASLAPPRKKSRAGGWTVACWREGKLVFIPPGGHLPPRCIRCNEPACLPMPQWPFTAFSGQHGPIYYGLCRRHTARRKWGFYLCVLVFVTAMVIPFCSKPSSPFRWPLEIPMLLFTFIGGVIYPRLLVTVSVQEGVVAIKGCRPPFLDSLPEGPDQLTPGAS